MADHRSVRSIATIIVTAAAIVTLFTSCGERDTVEFTNATFEIDPKAIGAEYRNPEIGIAIQPPVNWILVSETQRRAVVDALSTTEDDDEFSLRMVDIFFNTENLSVCAISVPTTRAGSPADADTYINAFEETTQAIPEQSTGRSIARMAHFTVNNVEVTQFRHIKDERIVFTLLFLNGNQTLIQLDFSIPTAAYQTEGIKLESSIGTLTLIE